MTTPLRLFKAGRPIDVIILNEFWNRVYFRLLELAAESPMGITDGYAVGRMEHRLATILNGSALINIQITVPSDKIVSSYPLDGFRYQSPSALSDEFEHSCYIPGGTYDFRVLGDMGESSGIVEWFINGVSIGTQDWYDVALNSNVLNTIDGIAIDAGWTTVRGELIGKHIDSTGYDLRLIKYYLVKVD